MLRSVNQLSIKFTPNPNAPTWDHSEPFTFEDGKRFVYEMLKDETVEVFGALFLSHHSKLIGYAEIARGAIDHVSAEPREIAKMALLSNAYAVVVCHNHPNEYGEVVVSEQDVEATFRIRKALDLLRIDLHDHLVVGADGVESIMGEPSPTTLATIQLVKAQRKQGPKMVALPMGAVPESIKQLLDGLMGGKA